MAADCVAIPESNRISSKAITRSAIFIECSCDIFVNFVSPMKIPATSPSVGAPPVGALAPLPFTSWHPTKQREGGIFIGGTRTPKEEATGQLRPPHAPG